MQISEEYDLSRMLATALKGRAPFVGIPMPGRAPLTLDRKRVASALKGVKVLHVEVVVSDKTESDFAYHGGARTYECSKAANIRYLRIEGVASEGRVHTCMSIRAIHPGYWRTRDGKAALQAWREQERRSRMRAITTMPKQKNGGKIKAGEVALRRLQKELENLGKMYPLLNPAVPRINRHSDRLRASMEAFKLETETKRARTVVGAIGAHARKESWTSKRLYDTLAEHGYTFVKMSAVSGKYREMYGAGYLNDYERNLHRFVHETGMYFRKEIQRRNEYERRDDGQTWGPERYHRQLEEIRRRRAVQSQIDSVTELLNQL